MRSPVSLSNERCLRVTRRGAEGAAPTPGPVRHHYTIGHGGQESASATPGRRESGRAVRYIGSMDTPTSVEGCTSCGALYTPDPGDQGVCSMCRSLLPPQPPARTGGTSARPMSGQGTGAVSKRAGRISIGRRALRRIAIGAAGALLVVGLGAWWMRSSGHTPSTVWTAIRRHSPSDAWSGIKRHSSEAWVAIRRHSSDAWIAIRRHTPFDEPDAKPGAVASATPPSRTAVRDATATRGTHRRASARKSSSGK